MRNSACYIDINFCNGGKNMPDPAIFSEKWINRWISKAVKLGATEWKILDIGTGKIKGAEKPYGIAITYGYPTERKEVAIQFFGSLVERRAFLKGFRIGFAIND
jgi:hypothetical protein